MSEPAPADEPMDHGDEDAEYDDEDEYDDDDDDIDAEAERMAERLRAELLADITRANAVQVVPPPTAAPSVATPAPPSPPGNLDFDPPPDVSISRSPSPAPVQSASSKKELDIIATMRNILSFLERDTLARSTLDTTVIPDLGGASVFNVITSSVSSGRVPKEIARPLHQSVVALARMDTLFGNLRLSNASSIQLDKGKRKRDHDEGVPPKPPPKRTYAQHLDLNSQIMEAVGVVSHALASSAPSPLDSALITPIEHQLHRIFLFGVTSSPRGGLGMNALQEIGGLIQVIGVLTGVSIGQTQPAASNPPNPTPNGIATAVYPCPTAGCQKTFARLYSLRSHQRIHVSERPFHCTDCSASFVRNHDLNRHNKLHDKKSWKCAGCLKLFSRPDAIKRHKKLSQTHGPRGEVCVDAEVIEVFNDEDDDAGRKEKRTKSWNGVAVNVAAGGLGDIEEGEINPTMLSGLQTTVLTLHPILQSRVTNALASNAGPVAPTPAVDQATLASVIARAQILNQPETDSTTEKDPTTVSTSGVADATPAPPPATASLSVYGLSAEQTQLLQQAIKGAADAAHSLAEAEAAQEEEEEFMEDAEYDEDDGEDMEIVPIPDLPSTTST